MIDQIILGDCLKVMKQIPDKSISLVVTDPPYQLDSSSCSLKSNVKMGLDKYLDADYKNICNGYDYEAVFTEFKRVLKKVNIFIFCSNKQIPIIMGYWKDYFTTLLVWNKTNSVPFANGVWRNDLEFIVHIREKGATFQGGAELKTKCKQYPCVVYKDHPTSKPIDLISRYILIGSNEGDVVLDPYSGSSTTAIAAYRLNRKFICIEKEFKYVKDSNARLTAEQMQMRMF